MTVSRSWLFVPGDSEKKLARAPETNADALILDLEDSVAPENKSTARSTVREFLDSLPRAERTRFWVRINPVDGEFWRDDVAAVTGAGPRGVMLPKARGAEHVERVARRLDSEESEAGLTAGSLGIVPIVTETPRALFSMSSYGDASPRLHGMTWGAEDLSAAIGAGATRDQDGQWTDPYRFARSLTLFAAHAAGVEAIDTLHAAYRDTEGLTRAARAARRDGFTGMLAIHPAQVDIINEAFIPSDDEVAWARSVVAAFAAAPGQATVGHEGGMLDAPHLKRAERILQSLAQRSGSRN